MIFVESWLVKSNKEGYVDMLIWGVHEWNDLDLLRLVIG